MSVSFIIGEWIDASSLMTLDEAAIDDSVRQRLNAALPLIEKTIQDVNEGKTETRKLSASDAVTL